MDDEEDGRRWNVNCELIEFDCSVSFPASPTESRWRMDRPWPCLVFKTLIDDHIYPHHHQLYHNNHYRYRHLKSFDCDSRKESKQMFNQTSDQREELFLNIMDPWIIHENIVTNVYLKLAPQVELIAKSQKHYSTSWSFTLDNVNKLESKPKVIFFKHQLTCTWLSCISGESFLTFANKMTRKVTAFSIFSTKSSQGRHFTLIYIWLEGNKLNKTKNKKRKKKKIKIEIKKEEKVRITRKMTCCSVDWTESKRYLCHFMNRLIVIKYYIKISVSSYQFYLNFINLL